MPSQNHVHRYKRAKLGKGKDFIIYQCVLPDCTHYLSAERIVGKKNLCWVCDKPHTIYQDSNGVLARPHCRACTKTKEKKRDDDYDFPIPMILP